MGTKQLINPNIDAGIVLDPYLHDASILDIVANFIDSSMTINFKTKDGEQYKLTIDGIKHMTLSDIHNLQRQNLVLVLKTYSSENEEDYLELIEDLSDFGPDNRDEFRKQLETLRDGSERLIEIIPTVGIYLAAICKDYKFYRVTN